MLSYLAINTDAASKHGNDADTMLPDHLPEVTDSVWQWSLCCYVPKLLAADFYLLKRDSSNRSGNNGIF